MGGGRREEVEEDEEQEEKQHTVQDEAFHTGRPHFYQVGLHQQPQNISKVSSVEQDGFT